jgi:hypothetical protein
MRKKNRAAPADQVVRAHPGVLKHPYVMYLSEIRIFTGFLLFANFG